jgi:hypothetical protein
VWASPTEATCPTRGTLVVGTGLASCQRCPDLWFELVSMLDSQEDRYETPVSF